MNSIMRLTSKFASASAVALIGLYAIFLGLLTTSFFQAHIVYLHKIQMTWFKDLDIPEQFGFLRGQTTPFFIVTPSGSKLYAWHILPVGLYHQHESTLTADPSSLASDITSRFAFKLLHDDPDARLVIHMHGAGGTVGSGYRVPNYRALSAGDPSKIHVLTFDYRGFGRSPGTPSEQGLCEDAIAVVNWVMEVAGIPLSRILIFSQSLGTAVALAVSEYFASQSPPVVFAGTILVAPFVDVPTLAATYRIGGFIPILSPLARFSFLFDQLSALIQEKWSSKDRIAQYVRVNEANAERYHLTLIHAEDDYDIPSHHTRTLSWYAVNASDPKGIPRDEFEEERRKLKKDLGAAGSVVERRTDHGVVREEIIKTGLHDVVMGNPVVTIAVMRIFTAVDAYAWPQWVVCTMGQEHKDSSLSDLGKGA